jgi:ribonuclease Z
MASVIVLGSGCALPSAARENTYLAVRDDDGTILVDCGGGPIRRLIQANIDPTELRCLIATHHHPDHIYGVPALMLGMWLMGRQRDLDIYGPLKAVSAVASLLDVLDTRDWPGLFGTTFHAVQLTERFLVIETGDFLIHATPVAHMVACIALRFESKKTGKVAVYSSDTEPCESLLRLGQGADLLLHEATGLEKGHSSPAQAGAMAHAMGARRLVLIHLPPIGQEDDWRREAAQEYGGPVEIAHDLDIFDF